MKKAMKLVSLVLAVVMLLGCLTACGSKSATTDATASNDTASNDTAAASDGGEIVIALISNTTGDYAQYGQPVRDGAMLYINQLNANGGINGKQVKVLEYDDKGDGVEAVNAYNLACDNGITAVFGATLTGTTIALADATYEDNMPQVTASATATGVTVIDPADPESEIRPNVFRACFIDPYQGEKMANYAVEKLSAKTAAVFYQTGNDYSEGLMNAFVEKAAELGLEIVDTEAFAEGDKDFKAQMTNIAAADPGELLIMNRAEAHKLQLLSAQPYERIVMHFSPSVLRGFDPDGLLLRVFAEKPLGRQNHYASPKFSALFSEFDAPGSPEHLRIHMLLILANVLYTLCSLSEAAASAADKPVSVSQQILQYVNLHLFEDISLSSVSRAFFLSASQLGRVFRQATGSSVGEYIRVKRLLAARERIVAGSTPTDACAACGFQDYSTFFRAYKAKFGCTPSHDRSRQKDALAGKSH